MKVFKKTSKACKNIANSGRTQVKFKCKYIKYICMSYVKPISVNTMVQILMRQVLFIINKDAWIAPSQQDPVCLYYKNCQIVCHNCNSLTFNCFLGIRFAAGTCFTQWFKYWRLINNKQCSHDLNNSLMNSCAHGTWNLSVYFMSRCNAYV